MCLMCTDDDVHRTDVTPVEATRHLGNHIQTEAYKQTISELIIILVMRVDIVHSRCTDC